MTRAVKMTTEEGVMQYGCPECGGTSFLTVEMLSGGATFDVETGNVEWNGTEVFWDTSTTIEIECTDCAWLIDDKHGFTTQQIRELLTREPEEEDLPDDFDEKAFD